MAFLLKEDVIGHIKNLIEKISGYNDGEGTFKHIENNILTHIRNADSIFVTSEKDLERIIDSLCNKFMFHGFAVQGKDLKRIYQKFLPQGLSKQERLHRLNVVKFLLGVSESPTNNIYKYPGPCDRGDQEEDVINWPEYLYEDIPRWSPAPNEDSEQKKKRPLDAPSSSSSSSSKRLKIQPSTSTAVNTTEQEQQNHEIKMVSRVSVTTPPPHANQRNFQDHPLIYSLMEIFPEACPRFIRRICKGKTNAPGVLDDLISQIVEDDYPKRQKAESSKRKVDAEETLKMLQELLSDADPSYLQFHCERLFDKPDELHDFVENAVETRSYPKLKDYERKQKSFAQQKQYTTEFSVENFLEVIPDPKSYFKDPKRWLTKVETESREYTLRFFLIQFPEVPLHVIRNFFKESSHNFLRTFKAIENYMKSERPMPVLIQNIPLLQEMAYVQHRSEIRKHIKLSKLREEGERAAAKAAGLLQTCSCCIDDEVMPKDIYTCENGCTFCKECVRRGAEVAFGDGKLDFACLNDCPSHFSLQTLQAVLIPKMFSKVATRKQREEVKAAGIEDLEICPFCDFAAIPAKDDKIFRCLNPECMKESCRLCKELSHVPFRCDEVEKADEVKKRTYIENKMTEALIRTCGQCGKKFIKAGGCNKMTCSCGHVMCYICGQPVKDYKHFNGPGGEKLSLCPLFSDTNHLHEEAVLKGAEEAKKEIERRFPSV